MTAAINCPVCGTPSVIENHLGDLVLRRCPDCDHCFTDLNSVAAPEQYETEYFEKEHRNWFGHPNLTLFSKLSDIILQHNPSASVLDVGCGGGHFLRYLRNAGSNLSLTGIDIAPNQRIPGIDYRQGDFFEASFARQFDVVASLAVIEHVADVTRFAKRMYQLCAPGGLVINMTVDERSLIYGVSRILYRAGYATPLKRLYSKHHLNHFTHNSLKRLLELNHLSAIETLRHNSPMAAVDLPETSILSAAVLRAGVWVAFQAGQLTGRTVLQTVISQK